jgi:hypothetical protein
MPSVRCPPGCERCCRSRQVQYVCKQYARRVEESGEVHASARGLNDDRRGLTASSANRDLAEKC